MSKAQCGAWHRVTPINVGCCDAASFSSPALRVGLMLLVGLVIFMCQCLSSMGSLI